MVLFHVIRLNNDSKKSYEIRKYSSIVLNKEFFATWCCCFCCWWAVDFGFRIQIYRDKCVDVELVNRSKRKTYIIWKYSTGSRLREKAKVERFRFEVSKWTEAVYQINFCLLWIERWFLHSFCFIRCFIFFSVLFTVWVISCSMFVLFVVVVMCNIVATFVRGPN